MSFRLTAACLITSTLLGAPLIAEAAPIAFIQADQYRLTLAEADGFVEAGGVFFSFRAQSYTDVDGSRGGFISAASEDYTFGGSGVRSVQCTGPEFASIVTVSANGAASVNATLDWAANPNCYAVNYSGPALTVRINGAFNGAERTSQSGSVTQQLPGSTFKFNYQEDRFSETFTGSTGFYTGSFTGVALNGRSTNRSRIK
jgi:hypothetical protein